MEAIINNLSGQLLALQAEINQRDQPIPTLQEVNTQVKLINAIDKVQRLIDRKNRKDAKEAKESQAGAAKQARLIPLPPTDREYISGDPPPVSRDDFDAHQQLLLQNKGETMTPYKGNYVNRQWLVYNLFQYCLPVAERRFIASVAHFRKTVNMDKTRKTIDNYIAALSSAA